MSPRQGSGLDARDAAARLTLRGRGPEAEHLPLPSRRHHDLQPRKAASAGVRRSRRADRELPLASGHCRLRQRHLQRDVPTAGERNAGGVRAHERAEGADRGRRALVHARRRASAAHQWSADRTRRTGSPSAYAGASVSPATSSFYRVNRHGSCARPRARDPRQVSGGGPIERAGGAAHCAAGAGNPGDATKTLAALVGMFVGLDYDQIATFVLGPPENELEVRRRLEFLKSIPEDASLTTDDERVVAEALRTLHRWWQSLVIEPADVAVSRIIDELGLLPHAAAGELARPRRCRAVPARHVAGRRPAAMRLQCRCPRSRRRSDDDGEAPLRPGRRDVLPHDAAQAALWSSFPRAVRGVGAADQLADECGRDGPLSLAARHGEGWLPAEDQCTANCPARVREREFEAAEDVRLLYVAASRAGTSWWS